MRASGQAEAGRPQREKESELTPDRVMEYVREQAKTFLRENVRSPVEQSMASSTSSLLNLHQEPRKAIECKRNDEEDFLKTIASPELGKTRDSPALSGMYPEDTPGHFVNAKRGDSAVDRT